jgi:hypothetical protein
MQFFLVLYLLCFIDSRSSKSILKFLWRLAMTNKKDSLGIQNSEKTLPVITMDSEYPLPTSDALPVVMDSTSQPLAPPSVDVERALIFQESKPQIEPRSSIQPTPGEMIVGFGIMIFVAIAAKMALKKK